MTTLEWQPTPALVRGAVASVVLILPAVVFGRPELLVLATPLLVSTVWMLVNRPRTVPHLTTTLAHPFLREGEGTLVRAKLTASIDVEHAVLAVRPHSWLGFDASRGVNGGHVALPSEAVTVSVPVRSTRWGRRLVGEALVAATSRWAGFRIGPEHCDALPLTTLPSPGRFDTRAPTPHPIGLVGLNPSRRSGDGSEFSSIRPFAAGDRLRRIHWRVTLRTGTIHVTTAVAEQDSNVMLVVDGLTDIGVGTGVGDRPSSLDVAVRAAGAIAEHYLHRGDRVGLRVLGPTRDNMVPTGAGNGHLRRLLDTLAAIVPGSTKHTDPVRTQFRVGAGAVVIVLSPMLSPEAVKVPVVLASRGLSVIVIDTLPDDPGRTGDERTRLAWRIRLLERAEVLRRVEVVGVPVVTWRGPGTLDEVLRNLGRRASRPRLVRR